MVIDEVGVVVAALVTAFITTVRLEPALIMVLISTVRVSVLLIAHVEANPVRLQVVPA